jgi:hypothetical protein
LRTAKNLIIAVVLIALTACSTIEIIHEPVGCVGQPVLPNFTATELELLSDETFEKMMTIVATYHERINTQCKINSEHDKLHAD